mmetsp:Transcript_8418/g.24133  ORF Transcript_8418/g.24133 Transcript_8418/m.24133 type:complete len:213 (+) Transcript_8418:1504-2142(+)
MSPPGSCGGPLQPRTPASQSPDQTRPPQAPPSPSGKQSTHRPPPRQRQPAPSCRHPHAEGDGRTLLSSQGGGGTPASHSLLPAVARRPWRPGGPPAAQSPRAPPHRACKAVHTASRPTTARPERLEAHQSRRPPWPPQSRLCRLCRPEHRRWRQVEQRQLTPQQQAPGLYQPVALLRLAAAREPPAGCHSSPHQQHRQQPLGCRRNSRVPRR